MGLVRGGVLALGAVAAVATGCGGDDDGAEQAAKPASPAPAATQTTPAPAPAPAETTEADTPAAAQEPAAPSASKVAPAHDPIARAAQVAAQQQGGLAVTLKGTIEAAGRQTTIDGKGKVDHGTRRGAFTISTGIAGTSIAVKEVMDGRSIYLNTEMLAGRLPGKKSWLRIDLAKAAREKGFDLSSLGTNGPSQDPSQVLDYLHGAGPSKKVGTETIRGVKTTHYRAKVDLARAARRSDGAAAKQAIRQLRGTLTKAGTAIPIDVWIDAQHRVRRERVRYTATINTVENTMDFTTDFTGFGVAVQADPPPASDTVDGLSLLRQAAKAKAEAQAADQAG
jgi:hypothetical protein